MLDTTDLPVQYSVNCAELAELPAGMTLEERPPASDAEDAWAEEPWTLLDELEGGDR